ncbi:hypothetical protein [Dickeya sp. NCPPB 3274]|uniref:hypothetical protein n=1 Tax=Dickeya sp. NCPPB 3274 TaxID=568766 RepID=UPI001268DF75|nr:hypothetical protein [Dickeya sp. NCPPB 3274]
MKISNAGAQSRGKISFSVCVEVKAEFDELKKKLWDKGMRIDVNDDVEKILKDAISKMKKTLTESTSI